jgi:acyl-CoA hydrolase
MVESFAALDNSNTGKPVSASRVVMTQLVLPSDTNALGSIFGGVIMSWIDICGAIAAQRHSSKVVVTASIDELNFVAPVFLGWVVNLKASINFVSKTSMEVGVRVDAENPRTNEFFHTATAYLTFVALDENRKAIRVRPLILETDEDRRRNTEGAARRALRLQNRKTKTKN